VDFIAGGNIIHRRRVFRPQALKQKAIFTTETTVNTEEKPSADCRASRNNLLIALISRHFPSVLLYVVVDMFSLFPPRPGTLG
jgi:hypothetical protein